MLLVRARAQHRKEMCIAFVYITLEEVDTFETGCSPRIAFQGQESVAQQWFSCRLFQLLVNRSFVSKDFFVTKLGPNPFQEYIRAAEG